MMRLCASTRLMLTLSLALAVLPSAASFAQDVQLLATLTNAPPAPGADPPSLPIGGDHPVYLWAYAGDSTSPVGLVCEQGATGDEICGIELLARTSGGFLISDFSGSPNFDSGPASLPFTTQITPDALTLRTNAFDLGVPAPAMRYIGLVSINTNNTTPAAQLTVSGNVVGANLELRQIPEHPVAVPEPAFTAATLAICFGLAGVVARGRETRRSLRA